MTKKEMLDKIEKVLLTYTHNGRGTYLYDNGDILYVSMLNELFKLVDTLREEVEQRPV